MKRWSPVSTSSSTQAGDTVILGIDLGTTNSLVAVVRDGKPEVLRAPDGSALVPSVVSVVDGELCVGIKAKKQKLLNPSETAFSVKRLLGKSTDEVREAASRLPYAIEGGEGLARIRLGDQALTAIEVSALILKELKWAAEESLGRPVGQAVITVPAYFNDSQRQATRAAGRLAGLDVLRILNEPTAAALAYGIGRRRDERGLVAVYDLGGGTFDISILKLHDGIFEVLATHGDTALGGDDLDQALVDIAAADIQDRYDFDALAEPHTRAVLIEAAERLKIELSSKESGIFSADLGVQGMYERKMTRAQFEAAVRPVLERTREPCLRALKDAGVPASDLTDVVLVGGPTRLAVVQQVAESIFGRKPNTSVHPDEVVAEGAAIQADILSGNNRELLLLDVVPLSLGMETYGGLSTVLIPRNSRIPTAAREVFTTFVDNQTGVDVHVVQGERERADDNRSLARFKLKGIVPMPAGLPRIEVTFLIDADGILNVAAKDLKSGAEQSVEVRPSFGLTEEEIQRMLGESATHAEDDVRIRKLVDARNDAQPVLRGTEKNLEAARSLLATHEFEAVEGRLETLRRALAGEDVQAIQQAAFELGRATTGLADAILKDALNRQQQGR